MNHLILSFILSADQSRKPEKIKSKHFVVDVKINENQRRLKVSISLLM